MATALALDESPRADRYWPTRQAPSYASIAGTPLDRMLAQVPGAAEVRDVRGT